MPVVTKYSAMQPHLCSLFFCKYYNILINHFMKPKHFLRVIAIACSVLIFCGVARAQKNKAADLKSKQLLLQKKENYLQDTAYLNTVNQLAYYYATNYPDSTIAILNGITEQCKKIAMQPAKPKPIKI